MLATAETWSVVAAFFGNSIVPPRAVEELQVGLMERGNKSIYQKVKSKLLCRFDLGCVDFLSGRNFVVYGFHALSVYLFATFGGD